jgi:hypothetical protein
VANLNYSYCEKASISSFFDGFILAALFFSKIHTFSMGFRSGFDEG